MSAPAPDPSARGGSWLARLRDHDHTQGSLLRGILTLSLPAIATSVMAFGSFQMGDLYLIGQLGPKEVAAVGAANQTLRQLVFLLLLGVGTATQMLVAMMTGAGKGEDAEHVAGQAMLIGLAIWLVAAVLGVGLAHPLISLVTSDPEVRDLGALYIQIAFPLLLAPCLTQVATAILTGAGDTTTPMLASFLVTPVALFAEWVLGFGHFGVPALGLAGIAAGAGVGGLVGAAVLVAVLVRGGTRVHLRWHQLRPDPALLRRLLGIAWQPAMHMVARTGIVFFFMALAGRLGGDVQAAYTIGLRVEMLAIMVAFPIANACATLVGQNLGAGSLPRAWRAIRVTFAVQIAMLWPVATALFVWRRELVSIFTDDPAVVELAAEYLAYTATMLGFYGLYFTSFRSLQAAGDMRSPMLISVALAFGVGIPLALYLTRSDLGATGMWIANLTYAAINTIATVGWLMTGRWARPHAAATPSAS